MVIDAVLGVRGHRLAAVEARRVRLVVAEQGGRCDAVRAGRGFQPVPLEPRMMDGHGTAVEAQRRDVRPVGPAPCVVEPERGQHVEHRLDGGAVTVHHPRLEGYRLEAAPGADGVAPTALFCDNETNTARLYEGGEPMTLELLPKDGIDVGQRLGAATSNPAATRTGALSAIPMHRPGRWACGCASTGPIPLATAAASPATATPPASTAWAGVSFTETVDRRSGEAAEFYAALAGGLDEERMRILRQAVGLIWSGNSCPYRVGQ